jgi:arsenate reductase
MTQQSVLFVCVHNAGRSQIAAGFLAQLSGGAVPVTSAGTAPADALNPAVVAAMLEEGVDLRDEEPKALTVEALQEAGIVITLGADLGAFVPDAHYRDWAFVDPAGRSLEVVRPIRDAIRERVVALLAELGQPVAA